MPASARGENRNKLDETVKLSLRLSNLKVISPQVF